MDKQTKKRLQTILSIGKEPTDGADYSATSINIKGVVFGASSPSPVLSHTISLVSFLV